MIRPDCSMPHPAENTVFHAPLTACPELAAFFSSGAFAVRYRAYERALVLALGRSGEIDQAQATELATIIEAFGPDHAALAAGTASDGVAVPAYVKALKAACPAPLRDTVHRGATSQDLIDTASSQALQESALYIATEARQIVARLEELESHVGGRVVTGVTRMQEALPMRAAERVAAWRRGIASACTRIEKEPGLRGTLQFAGAVGTGNALGNAWQQVADEMARELGLTWPGHSWQNDRSLFCSAAEALSQLTGALAKFGQDAALMALAMPDEIRRSGGGSSSAMPHKQNPVDAELLVTLHRHNAILTGGMHQALVHEMERSGAAWTLEWMLLPQIVETTGAALAAAKRLAHSVEMLGRQP